MQKDTGNANHVYSTDPRTAMGKTNKYIRKILL